MRFFRSWQRSTESSAFHAPKQLAPSELVSLLDRFDHRQGMMSRFAAASFVAVLNHQSARRQVGQLVEFGVYKGKSAFLLAHFVAPGARLVLVDIEILPEVQELRAVAPSCEIVEASSAAFAKSAKKSSGLQRGVRFLHVDGSHTFDNVSEDLEIAENLVSPDGLVVLDDFHNPHYSQVQAATYHHLYTKNSRFAVFLIGGNKAFLCDKRAHAFWLKYALSAFAEDMTAIGHPIRLARTDSHFLFDAAYFLGRKLDEPAIYGAPLYRHLFPSSA